MAQAIAAVVVLGSVVPQVRQIVIALAAVVVGLLGVVVISFVGYRLIFRPFRTGAARGTNDPTAHASMRCFVHPVERLEVFRRNADSTASDANPSTRPERPGTTGELIEQMRSIDWFQFEKLVALIYRKHGYSVVRRGGANPDGGVDLVLTKDGGRFAVQCKHWKSRDVGVRAVREFLGALTDSGIQKGVFITLCGYTGDARNLAVKHGIVILNETGLAAMIEGTDARFDPEALEILRDTRKFCPKCEAAMVVRTAKKGAGAGGQFWGCSEYPRCRFTMAIN